MDHKEGHISHGTSYSISHFPVRMLQDSYFLHGPAKLSMLIFHHKPERHLSSSFMTRIWNKSYTWAYALMSFFNRSISTSMQARFLRSSSRSLINICIFRECSFFCSSMRSSISFICARKKKLSKFNTNYIRQYTVGS